MALEKPGWLKIKLTTGENFRRVAATVDAHRLHTICASGSCPNMCDCWNRGTATLMILGNICTRSCRFCGVPTGHPLPVDETEPERVARSVALMKLSHAVLTSVDRDDLPDGGASVWAQTVRQIRLLCPGTTLETLIPDFQGKGQDLDQLIEVAPEIISHNMETVRRLTREVRIQARYERSLEVLSYLKQRGQRRTKSGIMLGLGETQQEVLETMRDIRDTGVDILTIGQYLSPGGQSLPVSEYFPAERFDWYKQQGLAMGFRFVESAPLVRSSYRAEQHLF